jgi:hypothetical protein
MKTPIWRIASWTVGAVSVAIAVTPAVMAPVTVTVPLHHIWHAGLIALGIITGLLANAGSKPSVERPAPMWIVPVVTAPMAAMYLMWPALFGYLDVHPALHGLDHLVFVGLGFITAYAGERYVRGVGWTTGILFECMALAAAGFFGVAPGAS